MIEGQTSLVMQKKRLEKMYEDLDTIKRNTRRALHELGLKHFEDDALAAMQRIADVKNSIAELDSVVKSSLYILYSSMSLGVSSTKLRLSEEGMDGVPELQPKAGPGKSQQALQEIETTRLV